MDEQELRGWSELDPVKRAAHFIRMNDIVVQANSVELSGWDSTFWRLPYWHREA
jgi:hypothetical protein